MTPVRFALSWSISVEFTLGKNGNLNYIFFELLVTAFAFLTPRGDDYVNDTYDIEWYKTWFIIQKEH